MRVMILAATLLSVGLAIAEKPVPQPAILNDVGIVQRLNAQLPLDAHFRDETGADVPLSAYFGDHKPVLLTLVYYECPMLCTEVLNGLLRTLRAIPLTVGRDFRVVTVSFNPKETPALAARKKMSYIDKYQRPGAAAGWSFLTGDESSIQALTKAVGFSYAWDAKANQYAHASAIMIVTPDGRLSRYFYGVEYPTQDVRLSLVDAASGRIGSLVDQFLLFCYHYDPATGRYGLLIIRVLQAAGIATVLLMGGFISLMLWREKHPRKEVHP